MEKRKIKVCLFLTVFGVIFMIITNTIILIDDEMKLKKINYIKTNVIRNAEKCVNDGKCSDGDITFSKLIEEKYLSGYFIYELDRYSSDSYVSVPSYEVILKDKVK